MEDLIRILKENKCSLIYFLEILFGCRFDAEFILCISEEKVYKKKHFREIQIIYGKLNSGLFFSFFRVKYFSILFHFNLFKLRFCAFFVESM